jgi:hypothetical protein
VVPTYLGGAIQPVTINAITAMLIIVLKCPFMLSLVKSFEERLNNLFLETVLELV